MQPNRSHWCVFYEQPRIYRNMWSTKAQIRASRCLDWAQPLLAPFVIKSTTHFHYGTLGFLNNQKDFKQTAQTCWVLVTFLGHLPAKTFFTDYHKKYSASSLCRQIFKLLIAIAEKSEDIHKRSCVWKYKVNNAVPGRYLHTEK